MDIEKEVSPASMDEPGGAFTYTVTITNNSVEQVEITSLTDTNEEAVQAITDLLAQIGGVLDPGQEASFSYEASHTDAGTYENTAAIEVKDDEGNTASDSDTCTATVTDTLPQITVTKTPSPAWVPKAGGWVTYTFVVTNKTGEPVTLTSLVDDKFRDITNKVTPPIGAGVTISGNGSLTFTYKVWISATSTYKNKVTATANDDEGNVATATAEATVKFIPNSLITNSSLCEFDFDPNRSGDQFRLLYILESSSCLCSYYRLNSSNPGQFYYNVFCNGDPGTPVKLNITIPYPFVTQGAQPVHAYSTYDVVSGPCGYCLQPGTDVTGSFTINNGAGSLPCGGKIGGVTGTITVSGYIPQTGSLCVTVHLDYGLKGTSCWNKKSSGAVYHYSYGTINSPQPYTFSFKQAIYGNGISVEDYQTTESENEFKKFAGFMGAVTNNATGDPVSGVQVKIYNSSGTCVGTVYTDADGYYLLAYKHTAKTATYTIKLPAYSKQQSVTVKANGFALVNFTVP